MDCLTLLKGHHDEVKKLLKNLDTADGSRAAKLWREIEAKLRMHEEIEESLFYPELKKARTTEDIVLEAYQEHHVIDVLIQEISALDPGDETFHPKVTVLQENTEHHIEEEETELFPKVRKLWDSNKRHEVGEAMAEQAERLLTTQQAV